MAIVTYTAGCRTCQEAEIQSMNIQGFSTKDLLDGPEYDAMNAINFYREENDITCNFCSSNNVEPFEIKVDGELIFEAKSLAENAWYHNSYMLEFELKKRK